MNKLLKLEALRGFAALYVVFHHTITGNYFLGDFNLSLIFRFGQEAVILFFILSGFVIELSFRKGKDKTFKLYFVKRFLRIFIPLIMVFLINYILICVKDGITPVNVYNLAGNLLMLQDVAGLKLNVVTRPFLGNMPLWSLSYEWWFYMVFFLFVTTIKKNISLWVYIISILCALSYMFYPFFLNRILMYLSIWWLGADLAKVYITGKPISFGSMKTGLTAIFICTIILSFNASINQYNWSARLNTPVSLGISPWLEVRHFAFAFIALVISIVWKKLKWAGFKYTLGPFKALAKISFGIYISYWFLILHANYLDFIPNLIVRFFLYSIICVLFAYVIEQVLYVKINKAVMNKFYIKTGNKA